MPRHARELSAGKFACTPFTHFPTQHLARLSRSCSSPAELICSFLISEDRNSGDVTGGTRSGEPPDHRYWRVCRPASQFRESDFEPRRIFRGSFLASRENDFFNSQLWCGRIFYRCVGSGFCGFLSCTVCSQSQVAPRNVFIWNDCSDCMP